MSNPSKPQDNNSIIKEMILKVKELMLVYNLSSGLTEADILQIKKELAQEDIDLEFLQKIAVRLTLSILSSSTLATSAYTIAQSGIPLNLA